MRICDFCKGAGYFPNNLTIVGSAMKERKDCEDCEGKGNYPEFTKEEKQQFVQACGRTWDAIGADVEASVDPGERITKAARIEVTLDADRMDMYGTPYNLKGDERKNFVKRMRQIRYSNLANRLCGKALY
jgi:DnaJ-class molecular chaperone